MLYINSFIVLETFCFLVNPTASNVIYQANTRLNCEAKQVSEEKRSSAFPAGGGYIITRLNYLNVTTKLIVFKLNLI